MISDIAIFVAKNVGLYVFLWALMSTMYNAWMFVKLLHYQTTNCMCFNCRFLMVFLCLLLSVFSTVKQYEEIAEIILYYLVSNCPHFIDRWHIVVILRSKEGWLLCGCQFDRLLRLHIDIFFIIHMQVIMPIIHVEHHDNTHTHSAVRTSGQYVARLQ